MNNGNKVYIDSRANLDVLKIYNDECGVLRFKGTEYRNASISVGLEVHKSV